ncbi:FMN-binding negative transcriptional regulator [Tibeticola sp.]|uniref:FMN-binding negative transcriptional regulator n=1 Tax=Tibeticola sp. TaxID=2005368 RepID=UPI0025DF27CE|nr:FMN-binding negative transcriptional regulator [Tibeticola sp.]
MYLPRHFASTDPAQAAALMRAHPLASLISTDEAGLPFVTHLPLHLRTDDDGGWTLLGHCARGNPHGAYLRERPRAVVTFLGPHAYLSPAVYPDLRRVPSWNYLAVHCTVQAQLLEGEAAKDALLKTLIHDHEPEYAAQWRALDAGFTAAMLSAITAFELKVLDWQCKLKLNQHRPESHAAMRGACAQGDATAQLLGEWMDRLGLGGPANEGDGR